MIGKTLDGKYRLTRVVGAGGMGSVYEAEALVTGNTVAVKLIHAALTVGDQFLTRFDREVATAKAIDTDHIVRILDAGTDPESQSPYMVMEYLTGEDVEHVFARLGPLAPDLALRICAQACAGLVKAHEARVVHRDIKPANLFLAASPAHPGARTVKILDFGIAKMRKEMGSSAETHGLTKTGSMLGSPLYMSPEQARSVKNVDHRSDLWSLGVVLFQALAGRTPYHHIEGLGDLIITLCNTPPPIVQELAPWVPLDVATLVEKALRIDPNERFQSAAEMLAAMQALLPGDLAIDDAMLTPLDEAARSSAAPRLRRTPTSASTVDAPASSVSAALASTAPAPSQLPSASQISTAPALTASATAVRPPARTSLFAATGAALLVGGIVAYALTRPAPAPASVTASVTAPASATASAPATASASATASAPASVSASASASASAAPTVDPAQVPASAQASVAPPPPSGRPVAARPLDKVKPPVAPVVPSAPAKDPPVNDRSSFGDRK